MHSFSPYPKNTDHFYDHLKQTISMLSWIEADGIIKFLFLGTTEITTNKRTTGSKPPLSEGTRIHKKYFHLIRYLSSL